MRNRRRVRISILVLMVVGGTLIAWGAAAEEGAGWLEIAKLTASDGADFDAFGDAAAISGDRMVVGAPGGSLDRVLVFERDGGGTWVEVAELSFPGFPGVGEKVAIDGETIVLGAYRDDVMGNDSGSAYVFERDGGGSWIETAKLVPSDAAEGDTFGDAVAVHGDRIVVGSDEDDDLGADSGSAYVFERDGGGWVEVAKLVASDGAADDIFGDAVAVHGDTVLVGARRDDDLGADAGSVYVFELDGGGSWVEAQKLVATDGAEGDGFGVSIAIEGTIGVVGADDSDALGTDSGAAYVFELDGGGSWMETARLLASDGGDFDAFGEDVAISGETIVIGSKLDDELDVSSGAAFVFERDGDSWAETQKLVASDGELADWFGEAIGISGGTIVAGASNDDDLGQQAGAAYVFERNACRLALSIDSTQVRAGEQLLVTLRIEHKRSRTVTVPFRVWVEDQGGSVVVKRTTTPVTLHQGDRLTRQVVLPIPAGTSRGTYRLLSGIAQMQQGLVAASEHFKVVD